MYDELEEMVNTKLKSNRIQNVPLQQRNPLLKPDKLLTLLVEIPVLFTLSLTASPRSGADPSPPLPTPDLRRLILQPPPLTHNVVELLAALIRLRRKHSARLMDNMRTSFLSP